MSAILLNNSARAISFLGGHVEGKPNNNGFKLIPTVRTALTDDHVASIKGDPTQARIMRAYIDAGDIVDIHETFADLPENTGIASAPKPAKPVITRFDSTTPESAIEAAMNPPAPVATVTEVASLPVPPIVVDLAPAALESLAGLDLVGAQSAIDGESVIETLAKWWQAESRPEVKKAIEKRGNEIRSAVQ